MFFKVVDGNKSSIVAGYISVERENVDRQYKALRCMSVPLEEVTEVIDGVIARGEKEILLSHIMGLTLKDKPTARATLPIREIGSTEDGWVPSIEVLSSIEHECDQFLGWLNLQMQERKETIFSKPTEIVTQVEEDLVVAQKLIAGGVKLSKDARANLKVATESL